MKNALPNRTFYYTKTCAAPFSHMSVIHLFFAHRFLSITARKVLVLDNLQLTGLRKSIAFDCLS